MDTRMDTYTSDQLFDRDVLDSAGHKLGSVDNVWADDTTGRPAFIGLKSGWFTTHTYVIPIYRMQFNDGDGALRLPYTEDQIKSAPELSAGAELTPEDENTIYNYYGLDRSSLDRSSVGAPMPGAAVGTAAAATAADVTRPMTNAGAATARPAEYAGDRMAAAGRLEEDRDIAAPLTQETFKTNKRAVEEGEVRIRKVVRTEHVSVPVELRSEHIEVERVAPTGAEVPSDAFQEREFSVPRMREEAVADKMAPVTGDIRKEDVVVDRAGTDMSRKNTRTETTQTEAQIERDAERASRDTRP